MERCSTFQWGGGRLYFRLGGFIFKWWGRVPHEGASVLMRGIFEKNGRMGERHPHAALTMGNPAHCHYVKTWNNSTCSVRDGISPQGERWGLNFATRSIPYDFGVISIFFSSWAYVALNMWYIIFIIESIYCFLKNWLDNDIKQSHAVNENHRP